MSQSHDHSTEAHAHEHGAGVYHRTLITLLILTAITVGAASFQFGSANVAIALIIATIKASLVALFFMHLKDDKPINGIIAIAGFLFLGIFLMFCLLDSGTRNYPLPRNMPAMEKPTPVPDTLNPLLAAPPKPLPPAPKPEAEGEEHK
jgi:cytochrome c oxidase subunit IV